MKRFYLLSIFLILLVAFILRTYKLSEIPSSLYWDEVDLGYQARSLLETGKDYRGVNSPFFISSFNSTNRTPIPVYMTAISTFIFDKPELQVRMAPAMMGTLIVGLMMWLVWLLTGKKLAVIVTGLVMVVSPWQLQFSRMGFEANSSGMFFILFLVCFYSWLKDKKVWWFYSFIVVGSLSVYTYRTMSMIAPLSFISLILIYWRDVWKVKWRDLLLGFLTCVMIMGSFLYATTIGSASEKRINYLSIFSDKEVPIWVQRNREIDSGDFVNPEVGKSAVKTSFVFHNKVLSWWNVFVDNYLKNFSVEFLFLSGDINLRHSVGKMGELYLIDLLGLSVGVGFLVRNFKDRKYKWLLAWILLAALPSAITTDGERHAHRLYIYSLPLLILVSLGWWQLIVWSVKKKTYWFILVISGLLFVQVAFYLHRYFVHYPLDSARSFSFGYKQAIEKIVEDEDDYDQVLMVNTLDMPILHYLFWAKIPPKEVQEYGDDFSQNFGNGTRLDKYKFLDWKKEMKDPVFVKNLKDGVLYLVTTTELPLDLRNRDNLPEGIKLVDVILYPDNEVAFYLISK